MTKLGINSRINVGASQWIGCNDLSLSVSGNEVDISHFGESNRLKVKTLMDCSGSISGTYRPADAGAVAILAAAQASGDAAKVVIELLTDGTNGFSIPAIALSVDFSVGVDGVWNISVPFTYDDSGTGISAVS